MKYPENLDAKEGSYSNRTGSRTPMQWKPGKKKGFSSAPLRRFYLPVNSSENSPDVESQEKDKSSRLNLVRRLLSIRRKNSALSNYAGFSFLIAERGR